MHDTLRRLKALVEKEFFQIIRDKSTILLGVILPLVLIILIGSGISLDVTNVPVAVVLENTEPTVMELTSFMEGSEYFSPRYGYSMKEAEALMQAREVDAIVRIPPDFTSQLARGHATIQGLYYGVDATVSTAMQAYVEAAVAQWQMRSLDINSSLQSLVAAGNAMKALGQVTVEGRMWFNDANTSTWFFIPGLIMLIMTIVGVFLTSVVMAREWERGTFEALFVTPVKPFELILAKIIPYYVLALLGMLLCLAMAKFMYGVPLKGSLWIVFIASTLYIMVSLNIGLLISAITKSQFIACQMALLISFLPSIMLTGFMFDLHSQPAIVSLIGSILPQTYYLELLKSLMLGGNHWPLIFKNGGILVVYTLFFAFVTMKITRKRVEG